MQKSCRCSFMYGELTDQQTISQVEQSLENHTITNHEILLYKKSGPQTRVPIWIWLSLAPIKNEKDNVVLFLLTFRDITALKNPIDDDSGKNLSKFARLARTVTRSRSGLTPQATSSQLSSTNKTGQDPSSIRQSQFGPEAPKTPPNILLHYGPFKTIWDTMILILTFYTAFTVPFNFVFSRKSNDELSNILLIIDSVVDIIFGIDIVINFHTTFVGPGGEVISDKRTIQMHYLKTWFIVDLLACLPYDIISRLISGADASGDNQSAIGAIMGSSKMARLLRLVRVVSKVDQFLEYGIRMLLVLLCFYMIVAHWLACIWFKIGDYDARQGLRHSWLWKLGNVTHLPFELVKPNRTESRPGNATGPYLGNATGPYLGNATGPYLGNETEAYLSGGPGWRTLYISSLYFTITCMTSVGFGNVAPETDYEKMFTIVMMIVGALLYATIFGSITTIIQQMMAPTASYHEMLNSVRKFMTIHEVEKPLRDRVIDYVVSTWANNKGIDKKKVLSFVPKDMNADICVHLNRKVFNEHPAFRLASDGCLRALATEFFIDHNAPGDLLYHVGEVIDSLCFVVSGSLEVIQDEEVVAILGKGDVFGDAFWTYLESDAKDVQPPEYTSTANVRSLTYCDLHSIKREGLIRVLNSHRQFRSHFSNRLVLTYNLRNRIIFRKIADLKHEQELEEMRQNQPQPEFGQDHIVRRLISKFRKPSDASAIGIPSTLSGLSNNSLQVPGGGDVSGPGEGLSTLSASELMTSAGAGAGATGGSSDWTSVQIPAQIGTSGSVVSKLSTKQNRWSQLVVTAAASASAKQQPPSKTSASGPKSGAPPAASQQQQQPDHSSSSHDQHRLGHSSAESAGGATSSNKSSSEKEIRPPTTDDDIDENYFKAGGRGHQTILENMDKRPTSGTSIQGTKGLDSQLASPMRSRVEIVARKSDHICVVRDVPEMRGAWYRANSVGVSHHGAGSGSSQQGSQSGSFEQATLPGSAAQMQAMASKQQQQQQQSQQSQSKTDATKGSSSAKPSLANLFGRHPAIKEEPTTPGGSLLSETPPPPAAASKTSNRLTRTSTDTSQAPPKTPTDQTPSDIINQSSKRAQLEAQLSMDQMNHIESLLSKMKFELKSEIAQLITAGATKGTNQVDLEQNKQMNQEKPQYQQTFTTSALDVPSEKRSSHGPDSLSGGRAGSISSATSLSSSVSLMKLRPPEQFAGDPIPSNINDQSKTKISDDSGRKDSRSSGSKHSGRDRSKSPHRSSGGDMTTPSSEHFSAHKKAHKHHHHHHHHHKADHSTPQATPDSSQLDVRYPSASINLPQTTTYHQAPSASKQLYSTQATMTTKSIVPSQQTTTNVNQQLNKQQRISSIDQSDDDQDATSKL